MNELMKVKTNDGKEIVVIDSREVAEMMGKTHSEIIQYLEGLNYKDGRVKITGIIPTLEQSGDLQVANYFIESTYNDRGRTKKCYLVTKMGCEMLGNKQQGEKGILFTAKYVERFNQYEEQLKELTQPKLPQTYKEALYALIEAEEEKERLMLENKEKQQVITTMQPKADYHDTVLNCSGLLTTTEVAKDLGMSAVKLNKVLNEKGVQYKQGKTWVLYSKHQHLINEGYCDYKITEHGQLLKWTELGRKYIIDLLKDEQ